MMKHFVVVVFILSAVSSCTTLDVYEKTKSFTTQSWSSKDTAHFTFEISDTSSFYNFYLVLRHQEKYPYRNLWLELTVNDPQYSTKIKKEFTLADNNKWLGTTIDDITDHRIKFNPQPIKLKREYTALH